MDTEIRQTPIQTPGLRYTYLAGQTTNTRSTSPQITPPRHLSHEERQTRKLEILQLAHEVLRRRAPSCHTRTLRTEPTTMAALASIDKLNHYDRRI
eukprot:COSAG01_NODE_1784_length_9237_cov_11.706829_7_plen_96_part_00